MECKHPAAHAEKRLYRACDGQRVTTRVDGAATQRAISVPRAGPEEKRDQGRTGTPPTPKAVLILIKCEGLFKKRLPYCPAYI